MIDSLQSNAERLTHLLREGGLDNSAGRSSAIDLAEANAIAAIPEPLDTLYLSVDEFRFGDILPFSLPDFLEVNQARTSFGELAKGVFVGSDLSDGWFFVDPDGFMGIGPGFVYWVDRGRMEADECVPCAASLIELLELSQNNETPWKQSTLGQRALDRFVHCVEESDDVETRAPVDPALFYREGQIALPLRLADFLRKSNGLILLGSGREFFGIDRVTAVEVSGMTDGLPGGLWIGCGPDSEELAMTTGTGWLGLPGERMICTRDRQIDSAEVLGRVWDVWAHWIREESV